MPQESQAELAPLEKGFLCLLSPPATAGELGMEQVPTEMAGKAGYVDGAVSSQVPGHGSASGSCCHAGVWTWCCHTL